jgi:hypothetical protein
MQSNPQWVPIDQRRNQSRRAGTAVAAALCLGFFAGTGGDIPNQTLSGRLGTGSYAGGPVSPRLRAAEQGVRAYLASIRSVLRLSVSELAQLFSVSRPTIYSWQDGNRISEENSARIRALADALEPHISLLGMQSGRITRRPIEGSSSVLQLLRGGRDPRDVVGRLVDVLQRENAQRQRLARRLQGKTTLRGTIDGDALG